MKSVKLILLGIAIILFGAACLGLEALVFDDDGIFEILGVISPFVGLGVSVFGALKKD